MKIKAIPYIIFGLSCQAGLLAQVPDTLMKLVLAHNKELKVAREDYQVAVYEAGTGNTPSDPEVEFAYLFSHPADPGNRIDFGVSQKFDFPSAYVHRARVKNVKILRAELEYLLARQQVLLEAKLLWIEQVYLNQMQVLLGDRLSQAEAIRTHVERKTLVGEGSALEMGQTHLLLASLEGEFDEIKTQLDNNQLALSEITGGARLSFPDTDLPPPVSFIPDSLMEDYRHGPLAQLYLQEAELKEQEKSLAVSGHLPRISAGYYSENLTDQAFRGLRLGVSVPLWENANTVNRAKAEVAQAEAESLRYLYQLESDLNQKLNRLESTRQRINRLEDALGAVNSISMLSAALENGEISLSEYFYNSDFYFRNQQQLLRYKRDLLDQEAELMKIYF